MLKTNQITMNLQPTYTNTNTNLKKDIEVLILKRNLDQKHERELWEDKFICLLSTKASTGLDINLKYYERELYEAFIDFTA